MPLQDTAARTVLFHPDRLLQLSMDLNANLALRAACRGLRDLAQPSVQPALDKRAAQLKEPHVLMRKRWVLDLLKHQGWESS